MVKVKRLIQSIIGVSASVIMVATGGTAAHSATSYSEETPPPVEVGSLSQLTNAEADLLASDDLKRVSVDPYTGDVTSVVPMSEAELNEEVFGSLPPQGSTSTRAASPNCTSTSQPCWHAATPSINYRFTLGTTKGTWGARKDFWTGNYYAKLCWIDPLPTNPFNPGTVCMPLRNGTKAWIQIGFTVTGKQVNVSSIR
ncbi:MULTISPECIES: hypothetical protein [unclassified Microbacterium]|uniref:hypothetical protein n=1 Tax=unclassified Microbacterium TaxID=2609290 RepID=UPI0025FEB760|nr:MULTISPECIES: hypothetical protein [unclassified Microbacterium]